MKATRGLQGMAAALLAFALTGCEPERSRWAVALQPDGSGRLELTHETAGEVPMHGPPPTATLDEEEAQEEAARFLASIEGVEAWTGIVATPLPGGRVRIEATGFFRALEQVRPMGEQRFQVARPEDGRLEVAYVDPIPTGLAQLLLDDRGRVHEAFEQADDRFRASVHRTRGFVEMSLAGWQFELDLGLPGPAVEVEGFEQVEDDRVCLQQDVESVLGMLERDLQALEEVRGQVRAGELTRDEGFARLATLLADHPRHVVRCEVDDGVDAGFEQAFEEAVSDWEASEWRGRVERFK
ncbi:MAG: hypothetical protein M9894_03545 [Planctomycetes bacterium]|nr:hypothetical protein [Planctomycetota bacterium]